MIQSLNVMLWGRKVGSLVSSQKGYQTQVYFYFDPEFVKAGLDIAPLRASIAGVPAQRGLPIYPEKEKYYGGLPSFIADSMPDAWGNTVFNEWARAHGLRQKDISPLDRLAYIGSRAMGALEFIPSLCSGENDLPFKVEIAQLAEFAATAMASAKNFHAFLSPDLAIESLFKVGTSAGGRRPKAVINVNMQTGECYSGQVAASAPDFVPMIIKFDEGTELPTTRIEYSYYLLAHEAGLHMMPSHLIEVNGKTHFLTERFDRRGAEKLHMQTLAAMNPSASSYEELFDVARRLNLTSGELQMLFLQMAMNVIGCNVDDHNKNFSFIMDQHGQWRLSPAYDFTFTYDSSAPKFVNRHSMTINGSNSEISRNDLLAIATQFNIKSPDAIISHALAAFANYPFYARRAGLSSLHTEAIMREFKTNLL